MGTSNQLSEELAISIPFHGLDIGATNTAAIAGGTAAENHWVTMAGYERFLCLFYCAVIDSSDDLTALILQQATDTSGSGVKTLLSIADSTVIDTAGEFGILEIHASKLDVQNSFDAVRVLGSQTGNSGASSYTAVYIRSSAMHQKSGLTSGTASIQGN